MENGSNVVQKVNNESKKIGLNINVDKAKVMTLMPKMYLNQQQHIMIDNQRVERVDSFLYLSENEEIIEI